MRKYSALAGLATMAAISTLSMASTSGAHEKVSRPSRQHSTWTKKTIKRRAKNNAAKIARRKNRRR